MLVCRVLTGETSCIRPSVDCDRPKAISRRCDLSRLAARNAVWRDGSRNSAPSVHPLCGQRIVDSRIARGRRALRLRHCAAQKAPRQACLRTFSRSLRSRLTAPSVSMTKFGLSSMPPASAAGYSLPTLAFISWIVNDRSPRPESVHSACNGRGSPSRAMPRDRQRWSTTMAVRRSP